MGWKVKMKKTKVIFDMMINIVATAIPTVVLQLLILPSLANYMSGNDYGLVVTILAVLNVIPSTIGNMLNNVRLLHDEEYRSYKLTGDFQILLVLFEALNIIIMTIVSVYYLGYSNIISNILLVVVAFLWLGREYHIVTFRLSLNYIAIMMNNIFMVVGYIIGFFLFKATNYWQFIYLFGFGTSYIYIVAKSKILVEPFKKTKLFRVIAKDTIYLIIATTLARAMNYADKILLYPLLGGTMVSIYYVATVFGKVVSLAITPINSVALSYLSKINKKPDSLFKWTYAVGVVVCIVGYIFGVLLSRPILNLLYPSYVDDAMKYILVTTATIVISVLTSFINPFVLRYFDVKWQICINGITTAGYIVVSLLLLKLFGMMGFCFGALIANVIKLFVTTLIYFKMVSRDSIQI